MTTAYAGPAWANDAPTALDELKEGYALKQAGNCRDALLHFARSFQLDPKPKAVLNLADCEAQTGDLCPHKDTRRRVGSSLASRMTRTRRYRRATTCGDREEASAAYNQARGGCTSNSTLALDGRTLDPSSIGIALPVNPGVHTIVVSAPGRSSHNTTAQLAEAMTQTLEVAPGDPTQPAGTSGESAEPEAPHLDSRRVLAIGVGGVGLLGLAVGIGAGIAAGSKHSTLENECSGNNCPPSARDDLRHFSLIENRFHCFLRHRPGRRRWWHRVLADRAEGIPRNAKCSALDRSGLGADRWDILMRTTSARLVAFASAFTLTGCPIFTSVISILGPKPE